MKVFFTTRLCFLACFLLFPAAVLSVPLSARAATVFNVPTNMMGMVLHLTFDGPRMIPNVRDNSSQGNHGNLSGQTSTSTVPGVHGQALRLDGTDDYVRIPEHSSLDLGSDFTVASWYNITAAEQYDMLYSKGGLALQFGFAANGFFACQSGVDCVFVNDGAHTLNRWSHVALTRSGAIWRLYINGTLFDEYTDDLNNPDTPQDVIIGQENDIRHVSGALDDYRLYNRPLSATEIARLYSNGAGIKLGVTSSVPAAGGGLIGHWTFDGPDMFQNVKDKGSGGNNGLLLGQPSTTTVPGRVGQAITLDGINDYVLINSNLIITNTDQTVCAWFYQKSGAPTRFNSIVNNTQYSISVDTFADPDITISVSNDAGGTLAQTGILKVNTWYHLCTTRAGGTTNIYINGILSGAANQSGGAQTTSVFPIGIGQYANINSNNFYGHLDDVRIYNRVLSLAEIRSLYGSKVTIRTTVPVDPASTLLDDLVAYWKLDEASGTRDDSVGANNLTDNNTVTSETGKVNSGATFVGANAEYLSIDDNPDLSLVDEDFTIAYWVKPTSLTNFDVHLMKNAFNLISYGLADGNLYFGVGGANPTVSAGAGTLQVGVWTHVMLWWDSGTNTAYISIDNGTPVSAAGSPPTDDAQPFLVGIWGDLASFGFDGVLDEMGIWRKVLSVDERTELYNSGAGNAHPF